ncbi:facilitated trehalose transporter Tret1-like [Periplaneta americana]|uniref:facilitated trehalose transporter Tret1-like n=1 Tax=Periplaneta americana TaxID=6978 RepID=UPI0037E8CBC5
MPEDNEKADELDVERQELTNGDDDNAFIMKEELTYRPDVLPELQPRWRDAIPQVAASCVAHSIVIQAGVSMAYSAVLLPQLEEPGSVPTATKDQSSWIASLVTIGTLVGSLVTGPLMDRLGRRTTCQLSCVPLVVAWIMVGLAQSVEVLYVGRLLAGMGGGLSTVALVYVSEVSYPNIRPMLLCLNSVFVSFGILLTCILAQWFTWREMAIWFGVMAVATFVALWLLPESPHWLATYKQKRREHMEDAVRWLNRNPQRYQQELKSLMETVQQRSQNEKERSQWYKMRSKSVLAPSVVKPVLILLFIFLFQQLSGGYVVIFYAVHVFQMVGGTFGAGFDEYDALVFLGLIRFVMSVITAVASRKYGRRPLTILSGLGMCISTLIVGVYMHVKPIQYTGGFTNMRNSTEVMAPTEEEHWTCVVCVLLYVCFCSLGVLVIPWTLIGELLPIQIRGVGGGVMVGIAYALMFGVVKSFPFVLDVTGAQGIFFFFSLMSLSGVAFVYVFLPETLGKSLQEIEDYFK